MYHMSRTVAVNDDLAQRCLARARAQGRQRFVQTWDTDVAGISEANVVYTRKDGSQVGIPATTILRKRGDLVEDVRIYMDLTPLFAPSAPEPEQQPAAATAAR